MHVPDPSSPPACPSVDSNSGLPCNRERGHSGEHRAEAVYGWTDPIDPSSPPAWAISMAIDFANKASDGNAIDLARLLASVREGAIREAAEAAVTAVAQEDSVEPAILSLLTTTPREATR